MSTFQEILDNVTWTIARPDLTARIRLACVQALHECHNLGFFEKDLQKISLEDLIAESLATWEDAEQTRLVIPLDRPVFSSFLPSPWLFKKLYKIEVFSDIDHKFKVFDDFKDRAKDPSMDEFKRVYANLYLQLGRSLTVNFGATPQYADFWYFAYPLDSVDLGEAGILSEDFDSDWMVADYSNVVEAHAIAKIAPQVGLEELAGQQQRLYPALHDSLYTNETTVE